MLSETVYGVSARVRLTSMMDVLADRKDLRKAEIPVGKIFYRAFSENGNEGYVRPWWLEPEKALALVAYDSANRVVHREINPNNPR